MRNNVRTRNRKKKITKKVKIIFAIIIFLLIISLVIVSIKLTKSNKNINQEQSRNKEQIEEQQIKEEIQYSMAKGENFVKIDNRIAYIDKLNGNHLYIFNIETTDGIKVNTEKELEKIYFDGKNIYGIPSHYQGTGIYKIDLQGNETKIYEGESAQLWLTDDKIYFVKQNEFDQINQTPQGNLCSMDKDGNNIETIISNVKNYFKIVDNKIYYTDGETRSIYKADITGENKQKLAEGRTLITDATDKYLIYLDYNDGEKYHIIYLENNENHEIGRFGNSIISNNQGYILTRKLLDEQNNIENNFSIFKINENEKKEEQIWTENIGISYLKNIYNNFAYIREQDIKRVNLENGNIEENIPDGYYLDGYCYQFKNTENKISQICKYNLETLEEEKIIPTYNQNSNIQKNKTTNLNTNTTTKQNKNKYTWKNESTQGKEEITKEQAMKNWEKERNNFGKNNNIIDYKKYIYLLNIEKTTAMPNSLFIQNDNSAIISADFIRPIWRLTTSTNKDGLQYLDVYIDCYTGEVIGGEIYGD